MWSDRVFSVINVHSLMTSGMFWTDDSCQAEQMSTPMTSTLTFKTGGEPLKYDGDNFKTNIR